MNMSYPGNFRSETSQRAGVEDQSEQMDQIRDLIVGDFRREMAGMLSRLDARVGNIEGEMRQRLGALEARLEQLETSVYRGNGAIESRVVELETNLHRRHDAVQARIAALSGEVEADRRTALDTLSQGMSDLADRVRQLSKP